MAIKYLKDDSTMLAVVCAVRGVDFGHINYVRHNTYQHLLYSGGLFSTIHLDLATQYINKQTEGMLAIWHSYSAKLDKTYIFTARCEHFTTGWEIDKEVVDGFPHAVEFGSLSFLETDFSPREVCGG